MKESFVLGLALFVTGALLLGMMQIAVMVYIPGMTEWNTGRKFSSALSQTAGWFPYVISILLMIVGTIILIIHFLPQINAFLDKEVPVDSKKEL